MLTSLYNRAMRKKISALFRNEFIQGGIVVTGASMLVNVINYLFQSAVAHSLGPTGLGEIAALFSYASIVSVPMVVLSMLVIQKIGAAKENKFNKAFQIEQYFIHQLKRFFPIIIISFITIPVIPRITNLSLTTSAIIIPYIFLTLITLLYSALLQSVKLFAIFSAISVVGVIVKVMGVLTVSYFTIKLLGIFIFLLLSLLITFILSRLYLYKNMKLVAQKYEPIDKKIRTILLSGEFLITLFSLLAITAFNNIDIIFVKKFFSYADAGLYASWSLFAKIILYILTPLISVAFVFFSNRQEEKAQRKTMIGFIILMAFVATSSYIAYNYAGHIIIPLFFGNRFLPVVPYLGTASLFGSLYATIFFVNNYFLAKMSKLALLLPAAIPLYVGLLFFFRNAIESIFMLNVYFAGGLAIMYIFSYGYSIRRGA